MIEKINHSMAVFIGYIFHIQNIFIQDDNAMDVLLKDVYATTPIQVVGPVDNRWFASVPNPDYRKGPEEKSRFIRNRKWLEWNIANHYITELKFHESARWLNYVIDKIEKQGYNTRLIYDARNTLTHKYRFEISDKKFTEENDPIMLLAHYSESRHMAMYSGAATFIEKYHNHSK